MVGGSWLLAEGGVKTIGDKGIGESFKLGQLLEALEIGKGTDAA
jgi:hypothetical protein